jgi:hypothetical protein
MLVVVERERCKAASCFAGVKPASACTSAPAPGHNVLSAGLSCPSCVDLISAHTGALTFYEILEIRDWLPAYLSRPEDRPTSLPRSLEASWNLNGLRGAAHSLIVFTRSRQRVFRLSVAHGHTQICSGNFGQTRLDWAFEDIIIDELHMIPVATSRRRCLHRMTTRRVGSVFHWASVVALLVHAKSALQMLAVGGDHFLK